MAKSIRKRATKDQIVDHLTALSAKEIKAFLRRHRLSVGDMVKEELRTRIIGALKDGKVTIEQVVAYLDEVTPWGKQHVFFFDGPSEHKWRDSKWVSAHLESNGLKGILGAKSDRLILPDELELASIDWSPKRLRVTAIRKREGWVRREEFDKSAKADGRPMELRAFVHQVFRGITAFEWNLVSNEAFLQVTQLPTGASYENAANEFADAIDAWLDLSDFDKVDLRKIIKNLEELIDKGKTDVELHALASGFMGQRRLSARSTSSKVPLNGNASLDRAMKSIRSSSVPRIADYFWPTTAGSDGDDNPRVHVIVVAEHQRINFATPTSEEGFRHVLQGLRKLSK